MGDFMPNYTPPSGGGSGTIDGTLTANRIPFASDSDTLTDDADFLYDSTNDLLTVEKVTGQNVLAVNNITGVAIPAGTPVYITNTVGAGGRPNVAPADSDDASKMPSVGIVTNQIVNGANGFIATNGKINGLPASGGVTTTTMTSADIGKTLYVATTAGKLTVTRPTGTTDAVQSIGEVADVNGGTFKMQVSNTARTNDVPNQFTTTGSQTASAHITTGGASTDFVKGDGTLDANTYLTSFTETDPVVGAINGIVKANGGGTISAATAGTDYLTPTGDGSGLSGVVIAETDPVVGAINGIVKANGGGTISAAVLNTDYVNPAGAISAVEGEGTLELSGAVTIAGESTLERAKVVTLSTGGGNTLTQATHGGTYCYVTAGNVTLFNIANVGDQVLIMNDSGGSITLSKDASDTIVGTTTILDEATVTCIAVTSSKWFVIG